MSIRSNGETFEIAVCRLSTVISGVLLETRMAGGGEWVVAWDVDGGTHEFARGEELEYAALREVFPKAGPWSPPELVVGGEVVLHTDDDAYTIGASFSLDAETYDSSRWFHPDGTATDDPC